MSFHASHSHVWFGNIVTLGMFVLVLNGVAVPAGMSQETLSDSCEKHAKETFPKFRVGYLRSSTYAGAAVTEMNISVSPKDIRPDQLISLVCNVHAKHTHADVLGIWIFDNAKSAKRFRLTGQGISGSGFVVRASYSYIRKENLQQLIWTPDPNNPSKSIKIRLGSPSPK